YPARAGRLDERDHPSHPLQVLRVLARLAAFLLGLLAGAMLAIGVGLVPYWQGLPPAEFRAWFGAHAWRIGGLMRPLGGSAVVVASLRLSARVVPRRHYPAVDIVGEAHD